jgi:hypothetical protein
MVSMSLRVTSTISLGRWLRLNLAPVESRHRKQLSWRGPSLRTHIEAVANHLGEFIRKMLWNLRILPFGYLGEQFFHIGCQKWWLQGRQLVNDAA